MRARGMAHLSDAVDPNAGPYGGPAEPGRNIG